MRNEDFKDIPSIATDGAGRLNRPEQGIAYTPVFKKGVYIIDESQIDKIAKAICQQFILKSREPVWPEKKEDSEHDSQCCEGCQSYYWNRAIDACKQAYHAANDK